MTSDNKARNYWVDDPKSADADWLKLVLRLRTLEGSKAGRFVTIDGRPVFIGGPGAGGGGVVSGIAPIGDENTSSMEHFLEAGIPGGAVTYEEIVQIKNTVVSDISELSGESYEDVNNVVAQWAKSSNDDDIRSLELQRDAAEEFGIPLSDFTQDKIQHTYKLREEFTITDAATGAVTYPTNFQPLLPSNQQRRILRTMYDNTQAKLAEAGYKPGDRIRLYRGVGDVGKHNVGDVVDIQSNVLSSWSVYRDIAIAFATAPGSQARDFTAVTFAMDVPIEMIMGSAVSGFGCVTEYEFVLLGVPSIAEVVDIGE